MNLLSSSWDNARQLLFEAVLSCEGIPSPYHCRICLQRKVSVRCTDCPKKFFCLSCDGKVHSLLPFHSRESYLSGNFKAIPPTLTVDEKGLKQCIGKLVLSVLQLPLFITISLININYLFLIIK